MSTLTTPRPRRATSGQEGSAFILALIVVMLLTILGLSLAVVTETEMQLGGTEKTIERQQFAAESGLWTKIAALALTNKWTKDSLAISETPVGEEVSGRRLGFAIQTTFAKALVEACPLFTDCGEDQQQADFNSSFVLTGSTAKRVGYPHEWDSPFDNSDLQRGGGDEESARFVFDTSDGGVVIDGQSTVAMGFYISPIKSESQLLNSIEGRGTASDGFEKQ